MTDADILAELTPWTAQRVQKLRTFASRNGIETDLAMGYRTCTEQNALYDKGISPSPGCRSWHTWGRAVDLRIPGDPVEAYRLLGDEWKRWGGIWGGDFGYGDYGHYEWHPGISINDACPAGTSSCPLPPWSDDRPVFARPSTWLGLGLAAVGVGAAVLVAKPRWLAGLRA